MQPRVLSFGATVWDVIGGARYIGGAPLNTAAHLAKMGVRSCLVTRVGDDPAGELALEEIRKLGVDTSYVQVDPAHRTGMAYCSVGSDGGASYEIPADAAYNYIEAPGGLSDGFDAFYFGTFEQKGAVSRRAVKRILETARFGAVFCDVNIRLDFHPADVLEDSLRMCTIAKMNDREAELISRRMYGSFEGDERFARRLSGDFGVGIVLITKGPEGYGLFCDGRYDHFPGCMVRVNDTIGAGDAFSAGFLACYCRTRDPYAGGRLANRVGSYVASQKSAVPPYPAELEAWIRDCLAPAPGGTADTIQGGTA